MDIVAFVAVFTALVAAGASRQMATVVAAAVGAVSPPRAERRPRFFPDPFATPYNEEEFKAIYRFYREDVRRLGRALKLPRYLRTKERDCIRGDIALLVLLYTYVRPLARRYRHRH